MSDRAQREDREFDSQDRFGEGDDDILGAGADHGDPAEAYDQDGFPNQVHILNEAGHQDITELQRGEGDPYPSDFDEMVDDRNDAEEKHPGDPLAQQVVIDDLERQRARQVAQPVRATPESFRGNGSMLGGEITIPASQVGLDPLEVARWMGIDEESSSIAIVVNPIDAASALIVRAFARVKFGTRQLVSVDIDIGLGQTIVVPGSAAFVSVGLDATSNPAAPGFRVGCTIAAIAARAPSIALRTSYIDAQAAGNTTNVLRPNFASTLQYLGRSDSTAQYTLVFKSANGTVIDVRIILASNYLTSPVYLPADCTSVDVTNNGGAPNATRLVWGLSL